MTCAMCRELRRSGTGMVAGRQGEHQVDDFADTKVDYVAIEVGCLFRSSLASHALWHVNTARTCAPRG